MTDTESKLRQRTDGRLDRSRDPAILDAALAALAEYGYEATNMNDIAARAGVGKAAIYRRWASKAALITDALVYWRPDLMSDEAPDTGSLTGDFELLVKRAARNRLKEIALSEGHVADAVERRIEPRKRQRSFGDIGCPNVFGSFGRQQRSRGRSGAEFQKILARSERSIVKKLRNGFRHCWIDDICEGRANRMVDIGPAIRGREQASNRKQSSAGEAACGICHFDENKFGLGECLPDDRWKKTRRLRDGQRLSEQKQMDDGVETVSHLAIR